MWRGGRSALKNTVIRAGYGINFNTGQFATFAQSLSFQPPFAATQNEYAETSLAESDTDAARDCGNMTAGEWVWLLDKADSE